LTYVILDLYCGAGGAAQGYADAGFDDVSYVTVWLDIIG